MSVQQAILDKFSSDLSDLEAIYAFQNLSQEIEKNSIDLSSLVSARQESNDDPFSELLSHAVILEELIHVYQEMRLWRGETGQKDIDKELYRCRSSEAFLKSFDHCEELGPYDGLGFTSSEQEIALQNLAHKERTFHAEYRKVMSESEPTIDDLRQCADRATLPFQNNLIAAKMWNVKSLSGVMEYYYYAGAGLTYRFNDKIPNFVVRLVHIVFKSFSFAHWKDFISYRKKKLMQYLE